MIGLDIAVAAVDKFARCYEDRDWRTGFAVQIHYSTMADGRLFMDVIHTRAIGMFLEAR